MRKILSFFAFAAIVFSFAACGDGGSAPEVKDFTIKIQALSTTTHVVITTQDQEAYYFWTFTPKEEIEQGGGVEKYLSDRYLNLMSWAELVSSKFIVQGNLNRPKDCEKETAYIAYAVRVEKDGTMAKTAGNIVTLEFKSMPANTLNGEFTVNAKGKKVHFAQSNRIKAGGYAHFTEQWRCDGNSDLSNPPQDLLSWSLAHASTPFTILEADEWYYLFRERPNAANLFAHATVNDVKGLIILPDNWEKPNDILMYLDADMNITWDEENQKYKHKNESFDAFAKNPYTKEEWKTLEFAGAVFLPAAGANFGIGDIGKDEVGWYWTSTSLAEDENSAHAFSFGPDNLSLGELGAEGSEKTCFYSIRTARRVLK